MDRRHVQVQGGLGGEKMETQIRPSVCRNIKLPRMLQKSEIEKNPPKVALYKAMTDNALNDQLVK